MSIAVRNMEQIDSNFLLGHMIFYNIPDIKIKHDELEQIFDNNNMNKDCLPPKIFTHDAFRRATGKLKNSIPINNNGYKNAKLNIDEVSNEGSEITRILGRKLINQDKEDVEYKTVAKIIFNRNTEDIEYSIFPGMEQEWNYEDLIKQNIALYKEWVQYHSKDTVKTIVNKIVKSMEPVTIIKGAYFIPKNNFTIVKKLKGIIEDLAKYAIDEIPKIEIIPLLDTVEQRDMIDNRVDTELKSTIAELSSELADIIKSGEPIHKKTLTRMTCQFRELQSKTKTYSTLLDNGMEIINQQLLTVFNNLKLCK